jgi:hypothetical protein
MLVVALIIFMLGCLRVVSEIGPPQIPKEESPVSQGRNGSIPTLLPGTDAYLGPRPPSDAVANLNILIEECRGTYEHLEHIRNIHRCLEFLSTKQDRYIGIPEGTANSEHLRLHVDIDPGRINLSSGDLVIANNHSFSKFHGYMRRANYAIPYLVDRITNLAIRAFHQILFLYAKSRMLKAMDLGQY